MRMNESIIHTGTYIDVFIKFNASIVMPPSNDLSPLKRLTIQLLRLEQTGLPPGKLLDSLNDVATKTMEEMDKKVAVFLGSGLDDSKHTQEHVKDVIGTFPDALSIEGVGGMLPIERAVRSLKSVSFVPLLAKEGSLRSVGGEESRGGLFGGRRNVHFVYHTMETLVSYADREGWTTKVLQAFKDLKGMGLIKKEDVRKHNLLRTALQYPSMIDFLVELDPQAWRQRVPYAPRSFILHIPLMHLTLERDFRGDALQTFQKMLKSAMKYSFNGIELLFEQYGGRTFIEAAFQKFGEDMVMKVICECIPPHDKFPILHHVVHHAPQLMQIFSIHYPDAVYLRDSEKRTLFLASLASGNKAFCDDPLFFLRATDEEVSEMDLTTELFPFALAASGDRCDLAGVYKLLRRDPSMLFGKSDKRKGINRKRKRGV